MTTKPEEKNFFENELVALTVNYKPHCVVEYDVKVSKSLCNAARKKAVKSVGKDVVVPGFRKGKAPVEIVAKRYPQELDKRWQEEMANRSYQQCAQLTGIPVISQDAKINFKMLSHSQNAAHLTLSFETFPLVPIVDPAKHVLQEIKRPEVSQEKVKETIRQTQMFFGEWKKVEDRPIQEGDFVIVNVEIIERDPPETLFTNTRFEVTDRTMAKWMKALILGKKPGDVVEGISKPDDHLSEEEKKQYPPQKARVTIGQIDEVLLPNLNDEFAKKLGVENIAQLEKRIEEILNKKADEHVRAHQREQVTQFLLSYHFELPRSVVEHEVRFRLQQMGQQPDFKSKWDNSSQKEREDMLHEVQMFAEKAIRIFYLCRKLAADQNIQVTAQDAAPPQIDALEAFLYPVANHHSQSQPDVKEAETYSRILLEKAEDWIIAHARTAPLSKETPKETPPNKAAAKKAPAPKKKASAEEPPLNKPATQSGKSKQKSSSKPNQKKAPKGKKD